MTKRKNCAAHALRSNTCMKCGAWVPRMWTLCGTCATSRFGGGSR